MLIYLSVGINIIKTYLTVFYECAINCNTILKYIITVLIVCNIFDVSKVINVNV